MGAAPPILEIEGLTRRFGGLVAVDGLSFTVAAGSIHGLIGPNGAGKTTTFNLVSGLLQPSAGRLRYDGRDIGGLKPSAVARLGLVRTFQGTLLCHELTVRDNLLIGCHLTAAPSLFDCLLGRDRQRLAEAQERAEACLERFGLTDVGDQPAGDLPHGLQRTLGVAVAVAARPRLLLLDEPFTGMNPEETQHMMALIRGLADEGLTVLLVEHDMQAVMGLCERITVMNFGRLLAEGTPAEIRADEAVVQAYLGSGHAA